MRMIDLLETILSRPSLTLESDYKYQPLGDSIKTFEKVQIWTQSIKSCVSPNKNAILSTQLQDAIIRAIFGSNQIEHAGLNRAVTETICRIVFDSDDTSSSIMMSCLNQDTQLRSALDGVSSKSVNEVVQHARAYRHIFERFILDEAELSEELIKETHRILVTGVPLHEDQSATTPLVYAGIYRTVVVGAGHTNFTVPRFVSSQMKDMCISLKNALSHVEGKGSIDPFSIATKYSLEFVQIHPFLDGNGRMCRLILNAISFRYARVIVPIGETKEDITEYINIKKRSSQNMVGHGDYAAFVLLKAATRLREMKKKLNGKGIN